MWRQRKDDWSQKVLHIIQFAKDLPAADACYHQQCSVNFRTFKDLPQEICSEICGQNKKVKLVIRSEAFCDVAKYIEENDE